MKTLLYTLLTILIVAGVGYMIFRPKTADRATYTPLAPLEARPLTGSASPSLEGEKARTPTTSPEVGAPVAPNPTMPNGSNRITLATNKGDIVFETYDSDAPLAAQNFINLTKAGFYDGLIFHRVIDGFMIQGGDPSGNGTGGSGYTFADELNPATESYKAGYKKGIVAMANRGPNTNGSQFFIMLADYPLPNNYTIFGRVISGQEVVDAIGKVETDPRDRPVEAVVIRKADITPSDSPLP